MWHYSRENRVYTVSVNRKAANGEKQDKKKDQKKVVSFRNSKDKVSCVGLNLLQFVYKILRTAREE